jgi:hypothetical protein
MGKYNAVLRRHGKSGFGVPTKAPDVGSFPLYPLNRARYALTILASPTYDSKTSLRARIAKRAIAAHPNLRSYWSQLNRETIKPRLSRSTRPTRRKAANPRRNSMARSSQFKYRVQVSVLVGSKWQDFSFVVEAPGAGSGNVKAAEKALAKKLKTKKIKLRFAQEMDDGSESMKCPPQTYVASQGPRLSTMLQHTSPGETVWLDAETQATSASSRIPTGYEWARARPSALSEASVPTC